MNPETVRDRSSWQDRSIAPMGTSVLASLLKEVGQTFHSDAWMWSEAPAEFAEGKLNELTRTFAETIEQVPIYRGVLELAASLRPSCHQILETFNVLTQKFEETATTLREFNLETFQVRCEEFRISLEDLSSSVGKVCESFGSIVNLDVEITIGSSGESAANE